MASVYMCSGEPALKCILAPMVCLVEPRKCLLRVLTLPMYVTPKENLHAITIMSAPKCSVSVAYGHTRGEQKEQNLQPTKHTSFLVH